MDEPEDADLDAWHTLVSAAHLHDHPGDPAPDPAQTIGRIFGGGARRLWAVPHGDAFGAVASVWLPGDPALRAAEIDVHVLPELRRRGVGAYLLGLAAEAARADGRSAVLAQALAGTPAVPFLERFGFRCLLTTRSLVLRPAEVDASAHAALNPPGYRLIRWTGTVPDHLAVEFAQAKSAMADHAEGESAWTADVVRDTADNVAKRGDDLYTVAALHGPKIVGFTEVVVPGDVPARAFQYDTAVVPGHRGRRIGLWVKAVMLDWLGEERPEVVEIETDNSDDNAHMLAVNEALGYRPAREFREYLAQAADLP